ncbi:hypothetical protein SGGMMB4_01814 [Sodalis glossinidius str. 'morsitans']|uniref:Uncharacterized protein n=1 Tax=Sodalis glossinidius (strain morsitans) TaxID=343509 RepID=Q2NUX0_SODGM|nr:hypothetical protein [Sodalis glossinidius]BAE74055.1 hypothetical protein SG0780 [Sodalis glossinidius str. 'morsitans']CRL44617.1 hypothetical protein SGGMMB4_01814 [Sodalis glossinidius str. 'morsitans']
MGRGRGISNEHGPHTPIAGRLPPSSRKVASPLTQPGFDSLLSATPPLHILLTAMDFSWAACAIASGALEHSDPLTSCALLWSSKTLALDAFQRQSPAALKYGNNEVNNFSDYRLQDDLVAGACIFSQTRVQPDHHGAMLAAGPFPAQFAGPSLLQGQAAVGQMHSIDHPLLLLASYAAGAVPMMTGCGCAFSAVKGSADLLFFYRSSVRAWRWLHVASSR